MLSANMFAFLLCLLGCHLGSIFVNGMEGMAGMAGTGDTKMAKMGKDLPKVSQKAGMKKMFLSLGNRGNGEKKEEEGRRKFIQKKMMKSKFLRETIKAIKCTEDNCITCEDLRSKLNMLVKGRIKRFAQFAKKFNTTCKHERKTIAVSETNNVDVIMHTPESLGDGENPAIVYAHIGGALFGSPTLFRPLISRLANRNKVVYIAVEFRQAPAAGIKDVVHDFYKAFKYIYENPTEFKIDRNRLAIAGDSYGGQIALATMAMLAMNGEGNLAKLAVLSVPLVSDYHKDGATKNMTKGEKEGSPVIRNVLRCLSPSGKLNMHQKLMLYPGNAKMALLKRMPPTIIFEKQFDMFKTEVLQLSKRMDKAGRLLHYYEQPGLSHRSMHGKAGKEYMNKYQKAIEEYLIN